MILHVSVCILHSGYQVVAPNYVPLNNRNNSSLLCLCWQAFILLRPNQFQKLLEARDIKSNSLALSLNDPFVGYTVIYFLLYPSQTISSKRHLSKNICTETTRSTYGIIKWFKSISRWVTTATLHWWILQKSILSASAKQSV